MTGNRPFGAVIVAPNGELALSEHNRVGELGDPTAHAEMSAMRKLCAQERCLTLDGFRIHTNAHSCPMCFAALVQLRIADLYYAAPPVPGSWPSISIHELAGAFTEQQVRVHGGILEDEAAEQLRRLVA